MYPPVDVYDGGDFGRVVHDRARNCFVLTCAGSLADPRHRDMISASMDAVLVAHPRYFVNNLSDSSGTASAADLALLHANLPAIVAGGTTVLVTVPPMSAIAGLSSNRVVIEATKMGLTAVTAATLTEALAYIDADREVRSRIA